MFNASFVEAISFSEE